MNRRIARLVKPRRSQFKGVFREKGQTSWRARIFLDKYKPKHLGTFPTELDAARAYDEAALRLLGPHAFLNLRDMQTKIEPIIDEATARVPTSGGKYFIIDIEDLPKVRAYYWNFNGGVLVGCRPQHRVNSINTLLLGTIPSRHVVVHLNADPCDCRKSNLAILPRTLQSGRNRKKSPGASVYKGVTLLRKAGVWRASILGRQIGSFQNEVEAAQAYDDAARRHFGMFSALNFPREGEISAFAPQPDKSPIQLAA